MVSQTVRMVTRMVTRMVGSLGVMMTVRPTSCTIVIMRGLRQVFQKVFRLPRLQRQVPSDIPNHNQFIPEKTLRSQAYIDEINSWTLQHKMALNEKKTKNMIFTFTDKFQFSTRLQLNQIK